MGRKALIIAIVLIVVGVALIVYQDPQFRLAINSSSTTTSSSSTRFAGGSSTQTISTAYNATDIIESLVGAGLVGVGLVFVGIGMFSSSAKAGLKE